MSREMNDREWAWFCFGCKVVAWLAAVALFLYLARIALWLAVTKGILVSFFSSAY